MPRISTARRERRRRLFIAAARRCFAAQGLAGATMGDITRQAATSVGAIYPYFATKDDLVLAAIGDSLDEFGRLLDGVAAAGAASALQPSLGTLVAQMVGLATGPGRPDVYKLMVHGWSHAQVDPRTADLLHRHYQAILDRFTAIAASWERRPDLGPTALGWLVASALLGSVVLGSLDLLPPALPPAPGPP